MGKGKRSKKGFTIIELIAVVAIIGGLVAMLAPVVTKQITKSRKGRIEADVNAVEKGVILHFADTSQYPANGTLGSCTETDDQINDLLETDGVTDWDGPYIDKQNVKFGTVRYALGCTYDLIGCGATTMPDPSDFMSRYAQVVVIAGVPSSLTEAIDADLDDGDEANGRVQVYGTSNTCMVVANAAE